ncbi:DUF669 domain-containing protein [Psychrobacillus sp. FSL K6-2365]|uniref:DUF669 domain-containing protein n=1 Tax=Psychrobacillus sp. FSL K6-2365 TaxID=2921546 RepID=UPI0030FA66C9
MIEINYDETSTNKGFEPISKGDYEVTIVNYEIKKANTGNTVVTLDYEIRSDVQQAHQGIKVQYDNFTITENAMWKIKNISKALGFPNKLKVSEKEWGDLLLNKNLIITVGHKPANADGKIYPKVDAYKETATSAPSTTVIVNESELPF